MKFGYLLQEVEACGFASVAEDLLPTYRAVEKVSGQRH